MLERSDVITRRCVHVAYELLKVRVHISKSVFSGYSDKSAEILENGVTLGRNAVILVFIFKHILLAWRILKVFIENVGHLIGSIKTGYQVVKFFGTAVQIIIAVYMLEQHRHVLMLIQHIRNGVVQIVRERVPASCQEL